MAKNSPNLPTPEELLEAALSYARRGFLVVPLHGIVDGECTCGNRSCNSPGKHPLISGWRDRATTDQEIVRQWWQQQPFANIGIVCGQASGVVVLDFDGEEGNATLRDLETKFPELVEAPAVNTGRGIHLYLAYAPELSHPSVRVLPGLDLRSEGSYVVAPPSLHSRGCRYEWVEERDLDSASLIAPPAELMEFVLRRGGELRPPIGIPTGPVREEEWHIPIPEGRRNAMLARLAGALFARGLTPTQVLSQMLEHNRGYCLPPLEDKEVVAIVESIGRREAASRGKPRSRGRVKQVLKQISETELRVVRGLDGLAYACLRDGSAAYRLETEGGDLGCWLTKRVADVMGETPDAGPVRQEVARLRGEALESRPVPVVVRAGSDEAGIWLDLGQPDGRRVKITPEGYSVTTEQPPGLLFLRPYGMGSLPGPSPVERAFDRLRELLNLSEKAFVFTVSWLVASLVPDISVPILLLYGPKGVGKSTATRVVRSLVDPSARRECLVACLPTQARDLFVMAQNEYVLAFDNVTCGPRQLAGYIASLVTSVNYPARTVHECRTSATGRVAPGDHERHRREARGHPAPSGPTRPGFACATRAHPAEG